MEICTVSEGSTESLKDIGQMKVMCYSYPFVVIPQQSLPDAIVTERRASFLGFPRTWLAF